jgi:hypothetical protein
MLLTTSLWYFYYTKHNIISCMTGLVWSVDFFIHSFNEHLLSAHCVQVAVSGATKKNISQKFYTQEI